MSISCLLFLTIAGPIGATEKPVPAPIENDVAARTGQVLFLETCSGCHGTDASGLQSAPDLRGVPMRVLKRALSGGENMPAFGLSEIQIKALYAYLFPLDEE